MHAKEQEIEKRKTQVREKVQAQLNRVEVEHRNLDQLRRVRIFFIFFFLLQIHVSRAFVLTSVMDPLGICFRYLF